MAVVVHHAEIAGAEAALLVEGACFERWVGVALEQHWSSDAHLALCARPGEFAGVGVDDGDRTALDRRAFGVRELVVGVGWRPVADHRALGHAVAVHDRHAHALLHGVIDLGRLRRATTRHEAQRRHDLAVDLLILGEEHLVERGRATRHGDTVFAEGSHRSARRELLDQHGRVPEGQHHDDVVGTADMGIRERHRADVVAGDLERLAEAGAGGDECLVGVEHTLGVRCRAGCVVAPADRRFASRVLRRRRQGGGVADRQVFVAVDERRWRVEIRCHLGDH